MKAPVLPNKDDAWEAFVGSYVTEMRASYKTHRVLWDHLLELDTVTLVCSCVDPARCHRSVLANLLVNAANTRKLNVAYKGERPRDPVAIITPSAHSCHAKTCTKIVPPRHLMCPQHWYRVPEELRRAVIKAYVPGQEVRKDPSPAYLRAANAAIEAVAKQSTAHERQGR